MDTKQKVYFPNLNGLRFIAAFLVIIHHTEQLKLKFGLENNWENPFIHISGRLGVLLFFVLSGFLITFLLLSEKQKSNNINIRNFYIRRVLRIWPLYYFVVLIGLFILPEIPLLEMPKSTEELGDNFLLKLTLFIFMLPNLALVLFSPVPYISQSWSIGVEEQFYLIWPTIIKKSKKILRALILVIAFYWSVRLGLMLTSEFMFPESMLFKTLLNFLASFNIDCMAIGGIAAYIYFKGYNNVLYVLFRKDFQYIVLISTLILLLLGVKMPYPIYAGLFAIIILNAAINPRNIFHLENGVFNFLGRISYGLYMYHVIAIVLVLKLLKDTEFYNGFTVLIISLLITVLGSSISYYYFERRFIKLKNNYSTIISGDLAKKRP